MSKMAKEKSLLQRFSMDTWYLVMIRGIILVIFGILLLTNPEATILTLVIFLGAYLFIDGWFNVFDAIQYHKHVENLGWVLFMAILEILAGIIVLAHPIASGVFTAVFLFYWIAFGAIIYGVYAIVAGIRVRKGIKSESQIAGGLMTEWALITGGILAVVFGVLLLVNPEGSSRILIIIWGILAILGGAFQFFFSFRMRKFGKKGLEAGS